MWRKTLHINRRGFTTICGTFNRGHAYRERLANGSGSAVLNTIEFKRLYISTDYRDECKARGMQDIRTDVIWAEMCALHLGNFIVDGSDLLLQFFE